MRIRYRLGTKLAASLASIGKKPAIYEKAYKSDTSRTYALLYSIYLKRFLKFKDNSDEY